MEEIVLRLQELLFPSITDVAVLSVDVSIAIVRVNAEGTATGAACPACEVWSNRVPTCGFPLMCRAPDEALFSG
ncbi:hypothetical protein ACFT5C_34120 [Streptomyces sp. NPDC057116]|uniref:hypothetical protein n=1 Tax=Streptomyces sp. NPDC057116 TaxID=3346023 RepID=UPI0036364881